MTTFRNTAHTLADALVDELDTYIYGYADTTREGRTARAFTLAASLLACTALYSRWLASLSFPGGPNARTLVIISPWTTVVLAGSAALSLLAAARHGVRAYRARAASRP